MEHDIAGMSMVDFERLLITKSGDIKECGNGKVSRKAIAEALGCGDDQDALKELYKKIRRAKCLERRGSRYYFKIEELIEPDEDVIKADADLMMMKSILEETTIITEGFDRRKSKPHTQTASEDE